MKRIKSAMGWLGAWLAILLCLVLLPSGQAIGQAVVQIQLGGFTANGRASNLAVSTTSARQQFSSAASPVALLQNVGSVDAYCDIGSSTVTATATSKIVVRAGQWFSVQKQAGNTSYVACITASSTTTMQIMEGNGLPLLGALGSGGGGGGAVTVADGADVALGAVADAAATQGGTGTVSAKLRLATSQLNSISTAQTAGTQKTQIVDGSGNVIASTSNNLNVQCANCSGSGASGTDQGAFTAGSSVFAPAGGFFQTTATNNPLTNGQWGAWQMTAQRAGFINLRNASGTEIGVTAAPLAVTGSGTAGSAASGVLSVQGIASMTPILANPGTAANWGVGATGAAVPANAVYVALNSGGNLTGWTGAVSQSGTWTVQPGNTANTTPWLTTPTPSDSSAVGITPTVSGSAGNNLVLKAAAGNLYSVYATNLTATAGFLVVLNATSAPADGAITPLACAPLPANGMASLSYNPGPPAVYSTGITAVITSASTCFTKTTGVITGFIGGAAK